MELLTGGTSLFSYLQLILQPSLFFFYFRSFLLSYSTICILLFLSAYSTVSKLSIQ